MATLTTHKRMTQEEFRRMPEGPPYYELEQGELILVPSPKNRHQTLLALLFTAVYQFVTQHNLGIVTMEVDVYFPDGNVYIPDMAFLGNARRDLLDPTDDKIHGVPDLAVELLSEDRARDRVRKARVYLANGVEWRWIVDPNCLTIEEYQATPEGYVLVAAVDVGEAFHPRLFAGLTLDLAALLGETPPASQA